VDTVRLLDHLLSTPSAPLALAREDVEGWESLRRPRRASRWVLAVAGTLLLLAWGADVDVEPPEDDYSATTLRQ
jgi:hypothetical protein